ncbi:NAD-dependent epimerase/dehydratase family protein [Pseudomonas sp. LB3P31]
MPVKRILVTGGAGYVGSHLARTLLDYGYSVRVLDDLCAGNLSNLPMDRSQLSLVVGDVTDAAAVTRAMKDCDAVIHLAALEVGPTFVDDPVTLDQNRFVGTLNICETMRQFGVKRVVFASMATDPGAGRDELASNPGNSDALADELLATEHFIEFYRLQHGLEPVMLQLSNLGESAVASTQAVNGFAAARKPGMTVAMFDEGRRNRELAEMGTAIKSLMKAVGALAPHAEPINDRSGQALKYQRNER